MYKTYTWTYRIEFPPYERIIAVLEAFFASYPGGDYSCEEREKYKLMFRRGHWKKSLLGVGPRVPERLVPGDFAQWPVIVRVLVRPSPQAFAVTVRYEVHLPRKVRLLHPETQASVNQHALKELQELAAYVAECGHFDEAPAVTPVP